MKKRNFSGITILLSATLLFFVQARPSFSDVIPMKDTVLGAPVYPGWTLNRKDDLVDKKSGAHWFQNQYFSDDPAEKVVAFYEQQTGKKAFETKDTCTFAITTSDGVVINIMGPPQGVEQRDETNQIVLKTWKSLISIIKIEQPKK